MRLPKSLTVPRPPDFVVGPLDDPYLQRWWVIPRNRWLNVYLHKFCKSDDDRALHDHPWVNASFLLRGTYLEVTKGRYLWRRPWYPVFRRATTAHRVLLVDGRPVWSLFLTGPVVREWGFHCPQGWRHWKDFVTVRDGGNERGRGCDD